MSQWPEVAVEDGIVLPPELAADPQGFARAVLEAVFAIEGRRLAISIYFCGDSEIARLHLAYLGDPEVTDVISFALRDESDEDGGFDFADGEVVVDVEHACRQAHEHGNEWHAECALYIAHGTLHLFGYDDHESEDAAAMKRAEQRVLDALGYRIAQRFDDA